MPSNKGLKRWEDTNEVLRRLNVALYGFDISILSVQEQKVVEDSTRKRWQLEEEAERRNPQPILSKKEEIEKRWEEVQWAKYEKVADGKPMKELRNRQIEKQLKILRSIVERWRVK